MANDGWTEVTAASPTSGFEETSATSGWKEVSPEAEGWKAITPIEDKQPPVDFWDDFKNTFITSYGDHNILNDNMFVNIGHGIGRIAADIKDAGWDGAGGVLVNELEKAWGAYKKGAAGLIPGTEAQKHEVEMAANFKDALVTRPGATAAVLVGGILTDPEMLVAPGGFGGRFAEAVGKESADFGKVVSKVMSIAGRVGESAAVGGATGVGIAGAEQLKTGEYNGAELLAAGESAGTFGALTGMRPKDVMALSKLIGDTRKQAAVLQAKAQVAAVKPKEERTLEDLTLLHASDRIKNAQNAAHDILKSAEEVGGLPQKQLDRIRKRNPDIGAAIDTIVAQRGYYQSIFTGHPTLAEAEGFPYEHKGAPEFTDLPKPLEEPKPTPAVPKFLERQPRTEVPKVPAFVEAPAVEHLRPDFKASSREGVVSTRDLTDREVDDIIQKHMQMEQMWQDHDGNPVSVNILAHEWPVHQGTDLEKLAKDMGVEWPTEPSPVKKIKPTAEVQYAGALVEAAKEERPVSRLIDKQQWEWAKPKLSDQILPANRIGYDLPPTQRGFVQKDVLNYLGLAAAGAVGASFLDPNHPVGAAFIGGIAAASGMWALPKAAKYARDMWRPMVGGGLVGTWAMYDSENKERAVEGAIVGAAAAFGIKRGFRTPTDTNVLKADKLIADNLNNKARYARNIWAFRTSIERDVPSKARRENLAAYIDKSASVPLTAAEKVVAAEIKKFFDETGATAVDAGVLEGLRENYVTHIIDWSGKTADEISNIRTAILGDLKNKARSLRTTSRYGNRRKYDTFDDLDAVLAKYNVKPVTRDIGEIVSAYGNSMRRAIEDKNLINALKTMKDERGRPLITTEASSTTTDYVSIQHPTLMGSRIHPDLAPALKFIADNRSGDITNAMYAVTMFAKRLEISANMFHAMSLLDVAVGAGIPAKGAKAILSGVPGLKKLIKLPTVLETYRKGTLGDDIDVLISKGLKVRLPDDIDPAMSNSVATQIGNTVAKVIPGADKVGVGVAKVTDALDRITWEHGYTGIKLTVAMKEMEKAMLDNAKARAKDPSVPLLTKEDAAALAAEYANDLGGGIDWFKLASNTKSQMGRKIAMSLLSQRGRTIMQIAMFAPDWTFATFRSMYRGMGSLLPKELRLAGVPQDAVLRGMYRRYAIRSVIAYTLLANLINYTTTGHSVMENQDITKVELGDGRRMYLSKHSMEFVNWMQHPRQEALNKLGILPSEIAEQLTGLNYLSANLSDYKNIPENLKMGNRLGHLAKRVLPLPLSQIEQSGIPGAISSFLGRPIYGEKTSAKEARKLKNSLKLSDVLKGDLK